MTTQTAQRLFACKAAGNRFGKPLSHGVLASVAAAGLSLALTSPAYAGGPHLWASGGSIGKDLTVCAETLGVRHSKRGTPFAHLRRGQTFKVTDVDREFNSEWVQCQCRRLRPEWLVLQRVTRSRRCVGLDQSRSSAVDSRIWLAASGYQSGCAQTARASAPGADRSKRTSQ